MLAKNIITNEKDQLKNNRTISESLGNGLAQTEYLSISKRYTQAENREKNQCALAIVLEYGWELSADQPELVEVLKKYRWTLPEDEREIIVGAKILSFHKNHYESEKVKASKS